MDLEGEAEAAAEAAVEGAEGAVDAVDMPDEEAGLEGGVEHVEFPEVPLRIASEDRPQPRRRRLATASMARVAGVPRRRRWMNVSKPI